jgi:hypothetical protein
MWHRVSWEDTVITEKSETSGAESPDSSLTEPFLSALQFTQDFTLKFVNARFDGAGEAVAKVTELAAPVRLCSDVHSPLEASPGSYVRVRA